MKRLMNLILIAYIGKLTSNQRRNNDNLLWKDFITIYEQHHRWLVKKKK